MKKLLLPILIISGSPMAQEIIEEQRIEKLDKVEVIESTENSTSTVKLLPENAHSIIDTSDILKKFPGANVNRNGPLTGIAQYRGLSGSRVNVQIDGTNMQESCSNSMDAAMSHVPATLVDAVILKRGISPVSSGIESIGGSVLVQAKNVQGHADEFEFGGEASLGFSSVNSGKKTSVLLSLASKTHDLYLGINSENGDNFDFSDGTNFNTEYDRDFYLMGYNYRGEKQHLSIKYNYNDTGNTGTPSLPMDIVYAEGGVLNVDYSYDWLENLSIDTMFSHQNTDHLMSNYLFRNTTAKKESFTQVNNNSYSFVMNTKQTFGNLALAIEGDFTTHQADISNPENAMFNITNFDTHKNRNSFYVELESELNKTLNLISGMRYTIVEMDANDVFSSVSMMQNQMGNLHRILQQRFNAANRNITDNNIDLSFNLQHQLNENLSLEYGLAYKTRSPSYQERYLWLPLEATAGMADGLQYFGNLSLNPEHATQVELGLNYQDDQFTFSPHIFYHQIKDYIQGTPTTSMPAPPNTLTFNNVDAKLYGIDIDLSYTLSDNITLNSVSSYVRGQRTDIVDNLYRIAPLNTRLELLYSQKYWSLSSELVAYHAQKKVSLTNKEQATAGYGLFNLAGTYSINKNTSLAMGINNLFDKKYANHLNGYNRNNLNLDVGFDMTNLQAYRLPSEGINFYATLYFNW
jgi:iron complex outermembrane receptor protein